MIMVRLRWVLVSQWLLAGSCFHQLYQVVNQFLCVKSSMLLSFVCVNAGFVPKKQGSEGCSKPRTIRKSPMEEAWWNATLPQETVIST